MKAFKIQLEELIINKKDDGINLLFGIIIN